MIPNQQTFLLTCWIFLVSFSMAIGLTSTVPGQVATGGLTGTVRDTSRGILPGVDVVVTHVETQRVMRATTNDNGNFSFAELPIGTYEVRVSLPGFQTLIRSGIQLLTGRTVNLNLILEVGEITQQVEVVGNTPVVQTSDAEVKSTINSREMRDLPLNGRNALQLVAITKGASFTSVGSRNTPEQGGFGNNPGITVNGLPATDNNYRIDGGNYNNPQNNVPPTLPNPDTLEEFTVKTSNYSAEHARAGGVVMLSTRSGTNAFHGTLYEFHRNDVFDARNFFADDVAFFLRNQFGGTFGGPIVKNKTFFFGSYEGTRKRGGPSQKRINLPTPLEREGDFSQRDRIIIDPLTGEPFPGNRIPSNRFSPISTRLLDIIPLPDPGTSRLFLGRQVDQDDDQFLVKVDHHFTDSNHLSVRYFYNELEAQRDTNSIPGVFGQVTFENQLFGVNNTHTFSPNFSVTGSFNWSYTTTLLAPNTPLTLQDVGVNVPLATAESVPELRVTMSGLTRLFSGGLLDFDPQVYEFRGHATWVTGNHILRFGVDAEHVIEDARDVSQGSGQFSFNGDRTSSEAVPNSGDAFADFLLGLPNNFQQRATSPQEMQENKFHPWIQDDWKVHPRVTINLGLRWEPWIAPTDNLLPLAGLVPGMQSTVAPNAPQTLVFAGAGVSDFSDRDKLFENDYNNFAPRFGFAWDTMGDGRTVVRGGYGVFYRSFPLNIIRDTAQRIAFRGQAIDISDPPSFEDPFANFPGGSPFPFSPPPLSALQDYEFITPLDTGALDPGTTTSYTQSWNLTVEREILPNVGLSLGYVGNHSVFIVKGREGNPAVFTPDATRANVDSRRIFPGLGQVRFRTDDYDNANYHGFQLDLVRRSTSGLSILGNYVFSKAIDINSSGVLGGTGLRNPFDPGMDRGPADMDLRHKFNLSFLYPVPSIAPGGFAAVLLNNWQLNSIITAQSGLPYEVTAGSDRSLSGVNQDNADLNGEASIGDPTLQRYFNTDAFSMPALGTFGTAGRNILYGPRFVSFDTSVFKDFLLTEAMRLQFRFEAFNFLNRANFNNPTSSFTNRNFGRITTAKDPRVLQFALKLIF